MNERILAGWMVLGLCGCAVDVREGVEVDDDSEALAQVEQELVAPGKRNKRGVVELQLAESDYGKCTGVMINSEYILTASRCVWTPYGDYDGQGKVSYFDPDLPDGEKREVTSGWDTVEVIFHGRYGFAFALVRRPGGWIGTDLPDYQRISLGSCINRDVSSFYGRGSGGSYRGPAGILRVMSVNADECEISSSEYRPSWFSDLGPYAACPGDIGGPYIGHAGEWDVVVGIMTDMDGGTDACADGGREQMALAVDANTLEWIEDEMNYTCHQYSENQHEYARCWDT